MADTSEQRSSTWRDGTRYICAKYCIRLLIFQSELESLQGGFSLIVLLVQTQAMAEYQKKEDGARSAVYEIQEEEKETEGRG